MADALGTSGTLDTDSQRASGDVQGLHGVQRGAQCGVNAGWGVWQGPLPRPTWTLIRLRRADDIRGLMRHALGLAWLYETVDPRAEEACFLKTLEWWTALRWIEGTP